MSARLATAVDESWIHVQLGAVVDSKALAEVGAAAARRLADARQVALDAGAMMRRCAVWRDELDTDPAGPLPGRGPQDVAALLRWLADGHFVLLGYQRCPVQRGQASVDLSSRLGVLRLRQRRAAAAD